MDASFDALHAQFVEQTQDEDTIATFDEELRDYESDRVERMERKFEYIAERLVETTVSAAVSDYDEALAAEDGIIYRSEVEGYVREVQGAYDGHAYRHYAHIIERNQGKMEEKAAELGAQLL